MINRVIVFVLDSFGVGEAPDANLYGDQGSNTLVNIYNSTNLKIDNMKKMGLYNIDGISIPEKESNVIGSFGKAQEKSKGKNSPVGHWEISGYIKEEPFTTYPNGFPEEIIEEFKKEANLQGILCNKKGSGTDFLKEYGEEHLKTGYPIIYTSADSVFQIAAHTSIIPVERLYEICKIARKILNNPKYNVGTVIARPFIGDNKDNFTRTYERKDFEFENFGRTMLDELKENNKDVIAIGKITDLFSMRGITKGIHTEGNKDGINKTIECIKNNSNGLIFTNLVDFDMLYGHRNNVDGYAKALEEFDSYIPEIIRNMKDDDMLIITADHGCDPTTPSTDHSREYIPILVYGKQVKDNNNIGIRDTFSDISATILDIFGLKPLQYDKSIKNNILK